MGAAWGKKGLAACDDPCRMRSGMRPFSLGGSVGGLFSEDVTFDNAGVIGT